jgi:hypothetical protein
MAPSWYSDHSLAKAKVQNIRQMSKTFCQCESKVFSDFRQKFESSDEEEAFSVTEGLTISMVREISYTKDETVKYSRNS